MDWDKFSGETIFRENQRVSCNSDSVESSGSENQKNGEAIIQSSTENRLNPSFHGSYKKPRLLTGYQNQTCLVDGCKSDLSNCKEYHRRHRVCDFHSKTPVVLIRNEEKRFCQQCSRFHSLAEFDDVKRSCRKRLDGHNRRRRKSQPESLFMNSRDFLSNCRGPILLQFSNPQIQVTEMGRNLWPGAGKTDEKGLIPANSSASDLTFSSSFLERGSELGSYKTLSFGESQPVDSGCALYLLSSHQAQGVRGAGLNSVSQTDPSRVDSVLHFDESCDSFGLKEKSVSMLQMEEAVGLLESEVPHKFPIYWE